MSAYVLNDKEINQLANTLSFYAEYGQDSVSRTRREMKNLLSTLKIENGGDHWNGAVIFLNETQANTAAEKLAKAFYNLNVQSVNERYNESDDTEYTGFKTTIPYNSPVQTYKSLRCLQYQCSEGDIPETDLFKRLEAISDALAHDIVNGLPAYDKAMWG